VLADDRSDRKQAFEPRLFKNVHQPKRRNLLSKPAYDEAAFIKMIGGVAAPGKAATNISLKKNIFIDIFFLSE
jgi:hypothetical protein